MPTIKFFAKFREEIGIESIYLDIDNLSLNEIIEVLARDYPKVREFVKEGFLVVNHRIVNDLKEVIKRDDEIAFLPKFSGG